MSKKTESDWRQEVDRQIRGVDPAWLVLGIDPGTVASGVALYQRGSNRVLWSDKALPHEDLLELVTWPDAFGHACVESIEAIYASGVGRETVRTIRFTGRLEDRLLSNMGKGRVKFLSPQVIRQAVTDTAKAKDPGVRQALVDKIGPVGTKKEPGPTYGVASHGWRGLAAAFAYGVEWTDEKNLLADLEST